MHYINRLLQLPLLRSLFLFGARNTGKSTLLKHTFNSNNALWIDLLDPIQEDRYARNPINLKQEVLVLDKNIQYIISPLNLF